MFNTSKSVFWLLFVIFALVIIYLLSPILMPFLVAALLAYLLDPLADRLEARELSRTTAVSVVFFGALLIILMVFLLLIPLLETQIKKFIAVLPSYITWGVSTVGPFLQQNFNIDPSVFEVERLKNIISANWQATGGIVRNVIQTISKSGFVVIEWFTLLALIPLLTFYLLRDWDRLVAYLHDLLPRSIEPTVSKLVRESDEILGAFLRGQLSVMLALSCIYSVGLSLVGLDFALLIGLIAGLVSFVPYLGFIVGIVTASIATMFQTQSLWDLLGVFAVFGVGQVVESFILTPWLIGERIGLHPVTVIFAIMAGGELFGFVGVLLALPVAAVIAVIMRYLNTSYKQSHIYRLDTDAE